MCLLDVFTIEIVPIAGTDINFLTKMQKRTNSPNLDRMQLEGKGCLNKPAQSAMVLMDREILHAR
jgi:hypothetical protein